MSKLDPQPRLSLISSRMTILYSIHVSVDNRSKRYWCNRQSLMLINKIVLRRRTAGRIQADPVACMIGPFCRFSCTAIAKLYIALRKIAWAMVSIRKFLGSLVAICCTPCVGTSCSLFYIDSNAHGLHSRIGYCKNIERDCR